MINDQDQSHAAALTISGTLHGTTAVTTEEALTEVLAFFCESGQHVRQMVTATVCSIYATSMMRVVPQSHQSFLDGLVLCEARPDKGDSLTDCISMVTMRQEGIIEVLTHDDHFTQEGFVKLS